MVTWCEKPTHWKSPCCWERLRSEGEGGMRRRDGWMASQIKWTWTWANSGRWWGTGKPGMLQSTGLQRVRKPWWPNINNIRCQYLVPWVSEFSRSVTSDSFLCTIQMIHQILQDWVAGKDISLVGEQAAIWMKTVMHKPCNAGGKEITFNFHRSQKQVQTNSPKADVFLCKTHGGNIMAVMWSAFLFGKWICYF